MRCLFFATTSLSLTHLPSKAAYSLAHFYLISLNALYTSFKPFAFRLT